MKQLYTKWGKNLDSEHILQEYPRPTLIRDTHYEILNGKWEYAITENNARPAKYDGEILVPFSPESILSNVSRQLKPEEYLWYRKEIILEKWNHKDRKGRVLLHFGAVDQICKVFINEKQLAEHTGGYLPFSVDITDDICDGKNELIVMVQDYSDTSYHARGKQKLKRGGMFYTAQSGIWQTVWLEQVPSDWIKCIKTRTKKDTERKKSEGVLDTEKIEIYVESNGNSGKIPIQIDIRYPEMYSSQERNLTDIKSFSRTLPEVMSSVCGTTNTWMEVKLPKSRYWTCEDPYLYYMHITMQTMQGQRDERECGDEVESYFAIRKYEIKNDANNIPRMYLNGKEQFQKGVLDQGYWPDGLYTAPSDDALIFDIQEMKKAGFNMVRKHIKIEPERWYYHCDRLGLIVWQDMVNGGERYRHWFVTYLANVMSWPGITIKDRHSWLLSRRNQKGRNEFIREVKETIKFLKIHPSICTWVIFNEGWGQFQTKKITEMVRKLDSDRFIDSASGWFDQGTGDFQSVHNYFFPLKVKPEKTRASVLSEYGGFTFGVENYLASEKKYGYGGYKTATEYRKAYEQLDKKVMDLKKQGLCGCVYTQWSDIEDEINGIYTYDREINKLKISNIENE